MKGLVAGMVLFSSLIAESGANVVFIAVDDLKPAIRAFGDPVAVTPNLDRLARRSRIFTNAHSQQAVCGPSRASVMTGLRPDTTGITAFGVKMREVRPDVITLPQLFKNHGFTSVGMGKIFDGRNCDGWGTQDMPSWTRRVSVDAGLGHLRRGFGAEETKAKIDAIEARVRTEGFAGDRKSMLIEAGANPPYECLDVADGFYEDGQLADESVRQLRSFAESGERFFLAVGFLKPHLPFNAPKKYWDMYRREDLPLPADQAGPAGSPAFALFGMGELRDYSGILKTGPIPREKQRELVHGYYAAVSYVDAQVGKILDALDETKLSEKTTVVLWSDHGFHLGDHGLFGKHTNYEQATRSPLFIAGRSVAPGEDATPVELLDIFPTVATLAGLPLPKGLEGRDLFAADQTERRFAFSQFARTVNEEKVMGRAVRSERFRYVRWSGADARVLAEELFDLQEDPGEMKNRAGDAELKEHLLDLRAQLPKSP